MSFSHIFIPNLVEHLLVFRYEQIVHSFSCINVSIRVRILFKETCKAYAGERLQSSLNQGFVIGNQNIAEIEVKLNCRT